MAGGVRASAATPGTSVPVGALRRSAAGGRAISSSRASSRKPTRVSAVTSTSMVWAGSLSCSGRRRDGRAGGRRGRRRRRPPGSPAPGGAPRPRRCRRPAGRGGPDGTPAGGRRRPPGPRPTRPRRWSRPGRRPARPGPGPGTSTATCRRRGGAPVAATASAEGSTAMTRAPDGGQRDGAGAVAAAEHQDPSPRHVPQQAQLALVGHERPVGRS